MKCYLNVHLDNCLSDDCGPEEGPKWDKEVTASDAGQVEKRIGNLEQQSTIIQLSIFSQTSTYKVAKSREDLLK